MACFGYGPENKWAYSEVRACAYENTIENCSLCRAYLCELIHAAFEKLEKVHCRAVEVLTPEEMNALCKTFFSKR